MVNTWAGYRAPITYGVTDTPIRIAGSKDPPFRIINLETNGTVWLSDNAGLRSGEGQPLRPGTSLLWVRPTELFAVCEPRESCTIIITTEIEDWQPDPAAVAAAILNAGILVIDNPVVLFDAVDDITPEFDISRFQSLVIGLANNSGVATVASIRFKESGSVIFEREIDLFSIAASAQWRAAMPCIGDTVEIVTTPAANIDIFALGSYRPKQTLQQNVINIAGLGNALLFYVLDNGTIAAGGDLIIFLPPWYGTITADASFVCTAAMGSSVVQWQSRTGSGNYDAYRLAAITAAPVTNLFATNTATFAAGDMLVYVLSNKTAVSFTDLSVRIGPTNGYGGS